MVWVSTRPNDDSVRYVNIFRFLAILLHFNVKCRSVTPPGWLRLVHPEGARYFFHEDKVCQSNPLHVPNLPSTLIPQNVYTDSDLTDFRVCERLMNDVFRLERLISTLDKPLPKGASLMIDVSYEDDNKISLQTEYYYVDHDERVIFFLHPHNTDEMSCTYEVHGPKSYQHLGMSMVRRNILKNLHDRS